MCFSANRLCDFRVCVLHSSLYSSLSTVMVLLLFIIIFATVNSQHTLSRSFIPYRFRLRNGALNASDNMFNVEYFSAYEITMMIGSVLIRGALVTPASSWMTLPKAHAHTIHSHIVSTHTEKLCVCTLGPRHTINYPEVKMICQSTHVMRAYHITPLNVTK